jgi:hypothetical protein
MDLLLDLKQMIKKELHALGYTANEDDELDAVLLRYVNVSNRVPRRISWDIRLSKEIIAKLSRKVSAKTPDGRIQKGIKQFIKEAKAGEDLKPRMSRQFFQNPDFQDCMFNDWGMFHFHLSTKRKLDARGLTKGTHEILFAISDPCAPVMYLVDVRPHKDKEPFFYPQPESRGHDEKVLVPEEAGVPLWGIQ